ncbi:MAG: DUF697 domain-containing protein [Planctomycetes bacterium]|nr:DUF697 domain-containing protein [Planctomycetota bacterium]
MLKHWFRIIRTAVTAVGVLLAFFAFIEVVRAYQTLRAMHPIVGYAFLAAIAAAGLWLGWYLWVNLAAVPKALKPPVIAAPAAATSRQLKKYLRYLQRFLERLTVNTAVSDEKHASIQIALDQIERTLAEPSSPEQMRAVIEVVEERAIVPALAEIDAQASRQVRDSMRDIMIGVTLSPYKSADLFIVIYRNLVMTIRIIRIYNARPAACEQCRILLDILNVIATVNYINMGKNLIEGIGSRVPGIGRFIDDIVQGIGAGFMTTIAGHAAMQRCRAFKGWNAIEAKQHLLSHVGDFYNDVKDIFFKDVWQGIRRRAGVQNDEAGEKIADALDETGNSLANFIRVPMRTVATSADAVYLTGVQGISFIGDVLKKTGSILTKPFRKK